MVGGNDDSPLGAMDVARVLTSLNRGGWRGWLREVLNSMLGVNAVHEIFERAVEREGVNVFRRVLDAMTIDLDPGALAEDLPDRGAVVVVANHPFGGADAVGLCAMCAELRRDMRVLANSVTASLPGLDEWVIPLQILGEEGSARVNTARMKESMAWLRNGGVLVVFPAGAVSRWRSDLGRVADPEWSPHIARLAAKADASVLPVRFFGRNPAWFDLLGSLHPRVRTALILRVFLASRGVRLRFRAGELIRPEEVAAACGRGEGTVVIREAVEMIEEE